MTCKTGDLVGIPFPYSDLSTQKRRPVLVVTAPDSRGDFMGLQVTSVLTEEMAVAIDVGSLAPISATKVQQRVHGYWSTSQNELDTLRQDLHAE